MSSPKKAAADPPPDYFFPPQLIERLLKSNLPEDIRIHKDVYLLSGELFHVFVEEAIGRAQLHCTKEGRDTVDIQDLEAILPQLLLDFG